MQRTGIRVHHRYLILTAALLFTLCCRPQDLIPLGTQYVLHSEILGESRKLNVHLPLGYSDTVSYPVIFLLDGSVAEDFFPVCGLVHNAAYPWIAQMPPSIVIGVENVDRRRDFTFPTTISHDIANNPTSGHSAEFISFLDSELIPWVTSKFRTERKILIGQSLGGLVGSEILLSRPALFDMYVLISPSLWWDNESLLSRPAVSGQIPQVFICYGQDEGPLMEKPARKLHRMLLKLSSKSSQIVCAEIKSADHANVAIPALLKAFEVMNWFNNS